MTSRISLTITLSPVAMKELERLSEKYKMPKSRVIEDCFMLGINEFEEKHKDKRGRKSKEEKMKMEKIEEVDADKYFRKILFSDRGWEEVIM